MTDQPETAVDRIPLARSVHYVARGLPEVPNQYGPGVLAPSEITLTYRSAPDSQLGRVHAYVAGRIWVDGKELPLLPGGLYGQHYFDGMEGWPAWLAEEARLHDPAAAPAPVLPPADRAAHVFPLPARAALITYAATTRTVTADDLTPLLDAFDAECSASALRKAADEIDRTDLPDDHVDMFDNGARWATSQLRRMAAEAQQQPEGEAEPESCAHCGKTIRRITGTLAVWWVHDPGGRAFCYPWQPARSTRATPKPAAEAPQPDTAHSCPNCEGIDPDSCLMNHDRPKRPMDPVHILGLYADDDAAAPDTGDDHSCAESGCSGEPTAAPSAAGPGRAADTQDDEDGGRG